MKRNKINWRRERRGGGSNLAGLFGRNFLFFAFPDAPICLAHMCSSRKIFFFGRIVFVVLALAASKSDFGRRRSRKV